MATDHRGRVVGNPTTQHGGHPVYPRTSALLSRLYGISPDEAASVIDAHRNKEELGDAGYAGWTAGDDSLIAHLGTTNPAEAIDEAFAARQHTSDVLNNAKHTMNPEPRPYWNGVPH